MQNEKDGQAADKGYFDQTSLSNHGSEGSKGPEGFEGFIKVSWFAKVLEGAEEAPEASPAKVEDDLITESRWVLVLAWPALPEKSMKKIIQIG